MPRPAQPACRDKSARAGAGDHAALHVRPWTILLTRDRSTPVSRLMSQLRWPSAARRRMSRTISAVRRALPLASPTGEAWRSRPFATMSRRLSATVPRNRWAGFTHGGLSQWWQTSRPAGMGPLASSHETRCARSDPSRPSGLSSPYPSVLLPANQGQHSSAPRTSTFGQKRSAIVNTRHPKRSSLLRVPCGPRSGPSCERSTRCAGSPGRR